MATRSLRKFSACSAFLVTRSSFLILVRPSTRVADLLAELLVDLGARDVGVLDHVVQQGRGDGGVVELELGQDRRDFEGMGEEGIAGGALLVAVRLHGVDVGAVEQRLVGARVVLLDPLHQLVLAHHATPRESGSRRRQRSTSSHPRDAGRADVPARPRRSARMSQWPALSRCGPSRPAAVGGRLGRRQALHAPQQLLLGDHVDDRVARLIVAPEHRPALHRQARRRRRLRLVDLDVRWIEWMRPSRMSSGGNRLLRDLAQRDHRVLVVLGIDRDLRAVGDRPGTVGRQQHQLEAVWNLVDAVFDRHARHAISPLDSWSKQKRLRKPASEARSHVALLSHAGAAKSRVWRTPRAPARPSRASNVRPATPSTGWRQCGAISSSGTSTKARLCISGCGRTSRPRSRRRGGQPSRLPP